MITKTIIQVRHMLSKKSHFLTFFFLSSIVLTSQAQNARQFLDEDYQAVSDSSKAAFYRVIQNSGSAYIVKDYYITGQIAMIAECGLHENMIVRNGKSVSFFKNGKVSEDQVYVLNERQGPGKTYHDNGKLKSEIVYSNGIEKYVSFGDSRGQLTMKNGHGTFLKNQLKTGENLYVQVKDSVVMAEFYVTSSSDSIYMVAETPAEFVGGESEMIEFIKKNLRYPPTARRMGVQGTVYTEFLVDKLGNVINPIVVRKIGGGCDEEALRVARLGRWKPAKVNNKPVTSKVVLPMRFKLN